jgi:hypothetical protein
MLAHLPFTLINLERLKMKTLANFENYNEFVYPIVERGRDLYLAILDTECRAAINGELKIVYNQPNGKSYQNPRCSVDVFFEGRTWVCDRVLTDIDRVLNMWNKAPGEECIGDGWEDKINYFSSIIAPELLQWHAKARFQYAQVAEKSMSVYFREFFDCGKVNGEYMSGTASEVFQAEEFEKVYNSLVSPSYVQILRGNDYTVSKKDGTIVNIKDISKIDSGKELDLLYECKYWNIFSTAKAHTALLDGGSRTSEYKEDLGATLQHRSQRFVSNGLTYEKHDGKWVLLVGQIDSRFFAGAHGIKAIALIQSMIGEVVGDTFLMNSATLAKFVSLIDIPEAQHDPANVIAEAFDKLAVEV